MERGRLLPVVERLSNSNLKSGTYYGGRSDVYEENWTGDFGKSFSQREK